MTLAVAPAEGCVGWSDPTLVAAILAVAPAGLGVRLRLPAGPERDNWLALLRMFLPPERPLRRCPPSINDDRLLGGLDLAATLAARRRVVSPGLLGQCDTGVLVLPLTDRSSPSLSACVAAALESGELALERDGVAALLPTRFGLVVLDDTADNEPPPPAGLLDRLAFTLCAGEVVPVSRADPLRNDEPFRPLPGYDAVLQGARDRLDTVAVPDAMADALCRTALLAGIASLRAPLLALRVARIVAALHGRDRADDADLRIAARLVLAPRATTLPDAENAQPATRPQQAGDPATATDAPGPFGEHEADRSATPPTPGAGSDAGSDDAAGTDLAGIVLDAVRAAVPAGLLQQLRAPPAAPVSRAPARSGGGRDERGRPGRHVVASRGRPIGSLPGDPSRGRIDVLATLRAALPWQALRQQGDARPASRPAPRFRVRREDLRIIRFLPRSRSVTIFLLDASGSAARARLAEAKGCVSILLAECYARRDQVALVECRNAGASVLLPPTGAVVRARRALDGLAGGGGTPLASGLDAVLVLAARIRRDGATPRLLLLTDGRANVARDGTADRGRALGDALQAARAVRAAAIPSLLVDISSRPLRGATPEAVRLAEALGGRCVALPRNDPQALAREAAASR